VTTHIGVRLPKLGEPHIELPTELGDVDLHNFADFHRLIFSSDGSLQLEWVALEPGQFRIGGVPIDSARLAFTQVERLALTPRDAEMPTAEDRALDHFVVEDASTDSCRLRFVFNGGRQLDVTAGRVSLLLEQTSHLTIAPAV
jgi:hypothetical protein